MTPNQDIAVLLQNLHRAFDQRSWHGPNLMSALRGLKPDDAAWRPQPERHNIWEYVVHAAYWKYRIIRLLDSSMTDSFNFSGSNFFERPLEPSKAALKEDIRILKDWHQRLLGTVESLDPADLSYVTGRSEFNRLDLILGAAAHDVYHAGQIRLIRRMRGG